VVSKNINIPIDYQLKMNNPTLDLAIDTIKIDKQALVFVNSKRSAEKTAEDIAKFIKKNATIRDTSHYNKLSEKILKELSTPTKQCERLAECIRFGIAFHHAGLTSKQRELIEDEFRASNIKIICSTPTLAAGVDLPAYRTILKDLRRYSGFGMNWIPVLEYLQQAGRAGRPNYDTSGQAIAIAKTDAERDEIFDRYICGKPEEIYSKLAVEPVLRTYVLSLIATGFVRTKDQLMKFFSKTFWAYQYQDIDRLQQIVEKMLTLLEEFEFIKIESTSDFVSADELEEEKIIATKIGKRVAELYIDPITAYKFICNLKKAGQPKLQTSPYIANSFSYLQMVINTLEMRPLISIRSKEYELIQEEMLKHEPYLLEKIPSMYEDEYETFLESIKTTLMLYEWIDEIQEKDLLEKYLTRPGELHIKRNNADWLLYSAQELARLLQFQPLIKDMSKLRYRLKYGAKEELLPLLQIKNIGRVRARRLFKNNIKDLGSLRKIDISALAQILGKSVAINIKKQMGEEITEIAMNKRKGQINLKDYDK
jgi:helicase